MKQKAFSLFRKIVFFHLFQLKDVTIFLLSKTLSRKKAMTFPLLYLFAHLPFLHYLFVCVCVCGAGEEISAKELSQYLNAQHTHKHKKKHLFLAVCLRLNFKMGKQ